MYMYTVLELLGGGLTPPPSSIFSTHPVMVFSRNLGKVSFKPPPPPVTQYLMKLLKIYC